MTVAKISEIEITDRQRKDFSPKELDLLKHSIVTKGLLQPVVLRTCENGLRLVAGERRIRAIKALHEEGLEVKFQGSTLADGTIPYVLLSSLTPDMIAEAELDENIIRSALTWQEQNEARALIYKLRQMKNPSVTVTEVAKETAKVTGYNPNHERERVARALLLDRHKEDPRVKNAKTEREAVVAALDSVQQVYTNKLRTLTNTKSSEHELIKGDCLEILPKLPSKKFAAIFSDPPYGMGADVMKKDAMHLYDDSPENALNICKTIIREGFRVCKDKAFLFMFCDVDLFVELKRYAQQQAWTVWRTPLIWNKGLQGFAPWGREGFTRAYETILFASKGQAGLYTPGGPDVLDYSRSPRNRRVHAAEKPRELLTRILKLATIPGDFVLDPCCGSASLIPAADELGVKVTGIELSDIYYEIALSRLNGTLDAEMSLDEDEALDDTADE